MLLTPLLPSAGLLAGVALTVLADVLVSVVSAVDALPGSVFFVPRPSGVWALAAEGWVIAWALGAARRRRRAWAAVGAGLALWLAAPHLPRWHPPDLRVDMLAVGNGSCFVVRSGGRTLVFDAGSSSDPLVGHRVIVPALRALHVRTIDHLAISHPNLDHFSAALEVVDAFPVGQVLITPQFARAARADPAGPVRRLLDELDRRLALVSERTAGDEMTLGSARVRWLHPARDFAPAEPNDASMVVAVEARGRRVSG